MGLKIRHGTAAAATAANPTLEVGELGFETDTKKLKIGDGSTAWTSLAYWGAPGGTGDVVGPSSSVASEVVLFDGTTGKLVKRATGSGIAKLTSGVLSAVTLAESDVTNLVTDLAAKQPLDSDLTTIAGLTATTDNFLVSVASAWASRTPAQAKATLAIAESDVTNLTTDLAAKQPLDADLTTIAGLTATTDNFLVAVASAWASRTPAQVKTTLAIAESDVASLVTDLAAKSTPTSAETQTNKRRQPRVYTTASTATLTPEIDTYDLFDITALATNITIANHSTSTPANGEMMRIRILDNATFRTITFGTNYVARGGAALPTVTFLSKYVEMGFEWYAGASKWVLTALAQE